MAQSWFLKGKNNLDNWCAEGKESIKIEWLKPGVSPDSSFPPYTQHPIQQPTLLALSSKHSANLKPLLPTTNPLVQAMSIFHLISCKGLLTALFVLSFPPSAIHHSLSSTQQPKLHNDFSSHLDWNITVDHKQLDLTLSGPYFSI